MNTRGAGRHGEEITPAEGHHSVARSRSALGTSRATRRSGVMDSMALPWGGRGGIPLNATTEARSRATN
jgi:hypothetical protein